MPCYTLPEGPPSRWGIRTAPRPEALSTFEAICKATDVLTRGEAEAAEAPDSRFDLDAAFAWFDVLVTRMWKMRGCGPTGRS